MIAEEKTSVLKKAVKGEVKKAKAHAKDEEKADKKEDKDEEKADKKEDSVIKDKYKNLKK